MEVSKKRKTACDYFPPVFDITCLAQTMMSLVSPLQYRQWILDTNFETQYHLCKWNPDCLRDSYVRNNLILKNNIFVLPMMLHLLTEKDWDQICKHTSPATFEVALKSKQQNMPLTYQLGYSCRDRLSNLQMLHKTINVDARSTELMIIEFICHHCIPTLHWCLNTMRFRCRVAYQHSWDDELWKTVENSVLEGRVVFTHANIMPAQMVSRAKMTLEYKRRQSLFVPTVENMDISAWLCIPSFDIGDDYFEFPFAIHRHWQTSIDRWEHVLRFITTSTSNLAFNETLSTRMTQLLLRHEFSDRLTIFRKCCFFEAVRVAQKIYELSNTTERPQLNKIVFDGHTNVALLELVFANLPHVESNWMHDCFLSSLQTTNIAMFQFVISKGYVPSPLPIEMLCRRTHRFAAALFQTHSQMLIDSANQLLETALRFENARLVEFLSLQDSFPLDNAILCKHITFLATMRLVAAIRKITNFDTISDKTIAQTYMCVSHIDVAQTLFTMFKPFSRIEFLICMRESTSMKTSFFDVCSFLIDQQVCTFADVYHTLCKKQTHHVLFDKFIAKYYADF